MQVLNTRTAILSLGAAAVLAGCGGGSGSKPSADLVADSGSASRVLAIQGTAVQGTTWNSVKFGGGGYVTGLIYHPTSPNVLYARTDVGGAYRWNQAASSWTPLTDGVGFGAGQGAHCIESMAIDTNNDQKLYMVAGCSGSGRVYVSNDRGTSWTSYPVPFVVKGNDAGRAIGERLKVDPNNSSTLWYASRQDGLYTSWDGGQTWYQRTGLSTTHLTSSAIGVEQLMFEAPTTGGTQGTWIEYAAVAPDYANAAGMTSTLYVTTNGGSNWSPVAVPSAVVGYHIPHMVRSADGYYYIVFNKDAGPGSGSTSYLYKYGGTSHNGTWTLLNTTANSWGGYGGVSVYGSGANARIALSVSGTWGDWTGQNIMKLSDDNGATWREIVSQMPHSPANGEYWGWLDDVEIDPNNRDHIMYVFGGGIWETTNASSATPTWSTKVNSLEETVTMAIATPPAGASYKLINSAGDVGTWVQTDLATKSTKGPATGWSNGNSADMAWSDSQYIAVAGADGNGGFGFSSGDGGTTWTRFASLPAGAATNTANASNIAVTSRNNAVFAPADSVPSYTTDNGAHWTATNLPALSTISGFPRSYKLAADRKNPNKVYAYDSGGAWWGNQGKVYVSTNGGHTFTLSQGSVNAGLKANPFGVTTMTVNPNAEGDIWLADGNTVYHSTDSGATWTKNNAFASLWGGRDPSTWPDVQGASFVTLGKAAAGAPYSAAVYVVGVINGQWGVWESDNAGSTWTRFNDDNHQFGGIGAIAGDWNTYGRLYIAGGARGIQYAN
jgi:hypothetical protein